MKLLLQNNPVLPRSPITGRVIDTNNIDSNPIAKMIIERFAEAIKRDYDMFIEKNAITGTGCQPPKWSIETFIANQSDETK